MTLLRRHGLWVIIATLAGIAGAWLYYTAQAGAYLATAQVDVESNPAIAAAAAGPNMATETQIATSGVVLRGAAAALGVTEQSLAGHLSAKVTSTSTVLAISCTMHTPAAAQLCANAAAGAYIGLRNLSADTNSQQARDALHVALVTPATLPTKPAGVGKKILLPLGAILGFALGVAAIVIRDHFDDRVRDRADLERWLGSPVLAGIPRIRRRHVDPGFVSYRAPRAAAAEAYRYLRFRLRPVISVAPDRGKLLLVAGPQGREGRTCVAANLARTLAQAGASVILVDADLRPPRRGDAFGAHRSLSEIFNAGDRPGLAELLAGTATLDDVALPAETSAGVRVAPAAGLRFVAAGRTPWRTADIFEVANLTAALTEMKATAQVVVADSPPLLAVSGVLSLARASDLVLMVADVRRTSRAAVSAAVREIRATCDRQLAGVLNSEPPSAGRRPPSGAEREPETLLPTADSPTIRLGGLNGHRPAPLGAVSARPFGPAGADDLPGTGPASG
jgi:polysaccharide biosynthesis transport protein